MANNEVETGKKPEMVEQRSQPHELGLQEEIFRLPRIGEPAIRAKVIEQIALR